MKAPANINVYHIPLVRGDEIVLRAEPWTDLRYRTDYLAFVDSLLHNRMDIAEFGTGGSTAYLAKRVRSIRAYESDYTWFAVTEESLHGLSNTTLTFDPGYQKSIKYLDQPQFHAVFIDVWHGVERELLVDTAMKCVKPGGYLVFHDHVRQEELTKAGWTLVKEWGEWKSAWKRPEKKGKIFFPYGVVRPFMRPVAADAVLDEFFGIAGELGIRAYVAFGLCLGLYRDGGYIEDDNDLDVVVMAPDQDMAVTDALKKHGFGVGAYHSGHGRNTHFYKDKILLDVFWRQIGEYFMSVDCDMVEYNGKRYPAPTPVEEYLEKCYTDWRTPSDEMTRYYG